MVQMDLLFKLAGLGVVVAVLCQVLTRAGREAVSYTHLDVYKRQGLGRYSPGPPPPSRTSRRLS